MNTNFSYQTFKSKNKSDIQNLDQLVEEDGIHYNMQALLKYPQSRAKIRDIQQNKNAKLTNVAVQSVASDNNNKAIPKKEDIESLSEQIRILKKEFSKFEPHLRYVYDMNNYNAMETSKR